MKDKDLIFLDTETTGNDVLTDRLFEVCFAHNGKIVAEYFKPPLPISVKAQSVTHVTNKIVEDKPEFKDSQMQQDLAKLLEQNVLVAHNAVFDICMLGHEGINVPKFICTLKVARFLDDAELVPEYNLQYLRYFFELEIEALAHDAKSDVMVLEALFKKQYELMFPEYGDHESVLAKMIEVSLQPVMYKSFSFGKHRGKRIEEVVAVDRGYLEWLLNQKMQSGQNEEDWIFTLKYYLNNK